MNTFTIAALAAVTGLLGGIAIGALLSQMHGPAPSDTPMVFAISSASALVVTIVTAVFL